MGFDQNAPSTAKLAESALDLSYEARCLRQSAVREDSHRARTARRDMVGMAALVATAVTALVDTVLRIIDLVRA